MAEELSPDIPHPDGPPAAAGDKAQLHIPGAGTIGMAILLVSLSMLFLASMVALVVVRAQSSQWPPAGFPRVPNSLWLSTVVIVVTSVTVHLAFSAVRRDDEPRLRLYLLVTFILGVLVLVLQAVNWAEFYVAIRAVTRLEGAYLGMFFVLTGLHAAHVVGGLIPLGIVLARAKRGRYSRNFHPGVRYVTAYWHFLDVIWLLLFAVIYF
jgi:cytochrome c oxidase subunit 3